MRDRTNSPSLDRYRTSAHRAGQTIIMRALFRVIAVLEGNVR